MICICIASRIFIYLSIDMAIISIVNDIISIFIIRNTFIYVRIFVYIRAKAGGIRNSSAAPNGMSGSCAPLGVRRAAQLRVALAALGVAAFMQRRIARKWY